MKKFLYWTLVILFAVITSVARICLFDGSSIWSYIMGMTYIVLCEIAHYELIER
jgi:hypothetical protein